MEAKNSLPCWSLMLEPEQTVIALWQGDVDTAPPIVIRIGYQSIAEHIFKHHRTPRPVEVEEAIMRVEDEIMLAQRDGMMLLPLVSADEGVVGIAKQTSLGLVDKTSAEKVLTREAVEFLFNRWADIVSGSPMRSSEKVMDKEFSARLLILRELLHHLNFKEVLLV
ncbi:MAG: hypothetical protein ACRCWR_04785 [Saezia sp.]